MKTPIRTILVAPDSFKGSLSARDAAEAMEQGIRDAAVDCAVIKHPISDGGEGLVEVLTPALEGTVNATEVSGPLPGQRVRARWGLSGDESTAIIEMAEAAGLPLVRQEQRNPKITTTYGVGELIRAALDKGISSLIIGIGGSATNDGGAGMAEALGVQFIDDSGNPLARGGASLAGLRTIDISTKDRRIDQVEVIAASDVQNPLCGEQGASAVYGPHKGATAEDVKTLDAALLRYAEIIQSSLSIDVLSLPGAGAAGGLGAGLVAFCGAKLKRGIDVVLHVTKFEDDLKRADLVITGEGKIDEQVRFGKALAGVIERARRAAVPVVAVVGSVEGKPESFVSDEFLDDLESLVDANTTTEEAIRRASYLIAERTKRLIRRSLIRIGSRVRP